MTDCKPSPESADLVDGAASRQQARGRLDILDDLRALAMSLVVAYHLLFLVFGQLPHVYGGLGVLADTGTALFVLLAGFLCQSHWAKFQFLPFLRKKMLTVVCPYAIATLLLMLMRVIRGGGCQPLAFIRGLLFCVLTGRGSAQLWFVPMLMIFFLLTPLTLWLMRRRWRHVVIALCFALSLVIGRAGHLQTLHNTLYFLPFYLLGMAGALDHERCLAWLRRRRLVLAGLSTALFFIACALPSEAHIQTLCRLVFSLTFIGMLAADEAAETEADLARKLVLKISATSFGIYLYHNSFIALIVAPIFRRYVEGLPELAVLAVLLVTTVATVLLMTAGVVAAQAVLKKLGVKNTRWLIA